MYSKQKSYLLNPLQWRNVPTQKQEQKETALKMGFGTAAKQDFERKKANMIFQEQ
jgi:hypothetical protein